MRNLMKQDSVVRERDLTLEDSVRGGPFHTPIRTVKRTAILSDTARDAVVVRYKKRVHRDLRFAGCMFIPYFFKPPTTTRYEEVVFAQC